MSPRCKGAKQRLEHWLWQQVDSEAYAGVRWKDKAQRQFQIPWINQKKAAEWKVELSQLFIEYAKHKGKLKSEGPIDHPKLKQNFKSAIGKSRAVKRLCKGNSKKFRLYQFEKDYSSPNEREDGNYQQTRNQSSNNGENISAYLGELGDVGTVHLLTKERSLAQSDNLGDSSAIDFLQDSDADFPDYIDPQMVSDVLTEPLQGSSDLNDLGSLPLFDEISMTEMVEDLHLSPLVGSSVTDNSQIQITTVDSTTENHSRFMEVTSVEQNLAAPIQAIGYRAQVSGGGISTRLTNNNMGIAGCTLKVHTDSSSAQVLSSTLGDLGHENILCNKPVFVTSPVKVTKSEVAVSLQATSQHSLASSSSSMETSEEQNNPNQGEASLPISVSSSTSPDTTGPQSLSLDSPGVQNTMHIQIIYSSPQRVVKKAIITSSKCKIFFGKVDNKRYENIIKERDSGAELVELPSEKDFDFNPATKTRIAETLKTMELGVVIFCRDNDIYVVRRCQSRVFVTDGVCTSDPVPRSHMKEPDQEIKAFDFAAFEKSVDSFSQKKSGLIDRDHFILTLGCEILKNDPSPTRVVPIRIDVQHWKAAVLRYQALSPSAYLPDPQRSISDSFDNAIHVSNLPIK